MNKIEQFQQKNNLHFMVVLLDSEGSDLFYYDASLF